MGASAVVSLVAFCLVLSAVVEARHVSHRVRHVEDQPDIVSIHPSPGRHPAVSALRSSPIQQGRVFPGAIAIKKLVLLKFKKIVPISLILLKSGNDNEAELVPVYPTSDIPANVQFIPTPNGISGHKDVQAIAIPNELHQQLQLNGLADLENIEALLNQAEDEDGNGESTVTIVQQVQEEDTPLNVKEEDEDQLLEGASVDTPVQPVSTNGVRRLAADDIKPGLKTKQHTAIEEIPLYLYSTKDSPRVVYNPAGSKPGGRYIAIRRPHA